MSPYVSMYEFLNQRGSSSWSMSFWRVFAFTRNLDQTVQTVRINSYHASLLELWKPKMTTVGLQLWRVGLGLGSWIAGRTTLGPETLQCTHLSVPSFLRINILWNKPTLEESTSSSREQYELSKQQCSRWWRNKKGQKSQTCYASKRRCRYTRKKI